MKKLTKCRIERDNGHTMFVWVYSDYAKVGWRAGKDTITHVWESIPEEELRERGGVLHPEKFRGIDN